MPIEHQRQSAIARAILDSAADFAIITTDLAGCITSWNAGAERWLGWRAEEMVGQNARMIFTPEDSPSDQWRAEMNNAALHGRAESERWHLHRDGTRIWTSSVVLRFEDERTDEHVGYLKIMRNRTAQHEQSESLRESERQYRLLTEALPGFVFSTDASGRTMFSNARFQRVTGRSAGHLAGNGWLASVHADDLAVATRRWDESLATGADFQHEMRIVDGQGQARWYSCRARPERDDDGTVVGWIGTCLDVEDVRSAQRELERERRSLAAVVSHAPVGILIASQNGRATLNERAVAVLGHDAEGAGIGRYAGYGAEHPDGRRYAVEDYPTVRTLRTGTRIENEDMLYRRRDDNGDTSLRHLEVSSAPLINEQGEIEGAVTILIDVEDDRQREEELRRREADLRLALDAGHLGTWRLDFGSRVLTTSAAYRRQHGRSAGDQLSFDDILAGVHPDDQPRITAKVKQAMVSGDDYMDEYRFCWPDGTEHWIEMRGRVERDTAGTPVTFTGVTTNIDLRKAHEAALHELNLQLEHAVDTRTAELQQSTESLQTQIVARTQAEDALRQAQKMEAVGQLTGGVAHDFNNLLTIIKSSVELLGRPNLPEQKRTRYIQAISDTADRAAKLTQQLLAFARRQPLTPTLFDVREKIDALLPMLRTTVGPCIAVELAPSTGEVLTEVDLNQFETALLNITLNARDAMPDGGTLTISVDRATEVPATRNHVAAPGEYIVVQLADTGMGMDAETLTRIFEPFYTTKSIDRGTGLGLSQVYGFAKQSSGEVIAESHQGTGTVFTLFLPRATTLMSVQPPQQTEAQSLGRERRHGCILIVEDNQLVGEFARQILEDIGYGTVWATNAQEALDELAIDPGRFHAIFSDVVMPGMSGIDLALEVRRSHPELPVVLTSGYSQALATEGTHGFELLHKPYSASRVIETLDRVASRRQQP